MNIKQLNKLLEYMADDGNTSIFDAEEGYDIQKDNKKIGHIDDLYELHDFLIENTLTLKDVEVCDSYTGYRIPKEELKDLT